MKAFEFVSPLNAGIPTKLGLFSDIHFDSPNCDKVTLKKHFDYCLKDQRYILIGGDLFDAILLKDQKRAVNHLMEKSDNQLNVKIEEAAHFLEPYKNLILFLGRGNHEESVLKFNGFDILQMLTVLLNAGNKNHQIECGNYTNFIRFTWTKGSADRARLHYDVLQSHGFGSSAAVTKGAIDFNRIIHGSNADLCWLGHKHNATILASDPLMYIDSFGEVRMKNRQAIMTPSYQKAKTIDPNINFAERFYTHQSLPGFGEVNLTPRYEDRVAYLDSEVKLNINPALPIGQVISQKLQKRVRQR